VQSIKLRNTSTRLIDSWRQENNRRTRHRRVTCVLDRDTAMEEDGVRSAAARLFSSSSTGAQPSAICHRLGWPWCSLAERLLSSPRPKSLSPKSRATRTRLLTTSLYL
jgi:hypothetical protein